MATLSGVLIYVHLRAEASERERWKEAAERSGRTLSAMIRDALEVELERCDHGQAEQGSSPSVATQTRSAHASLEERLAGLTELVDGLGVAPPLPPPVEGEHRTEATSALERLLTD